MAFKFSKSVLSLMLFASLPAMAAAQERNVAWTNQVNVTVTGDVLQKTGGCDGCDGAGATWRQAIVEGDGYIQFTIGESNSLWLAGFSHGDTGTSFTEIDYAFRFNGAGWADVWENGVYRAGGDTPYAVGDVFRISVVAGQVLYSRNGRFLRVSQVAPEYPLLLDTALGTLGASVRDAKIGVTPPLPI